MEILNSFLLFSGSECKLRWTSLRDQYREYLENCTAKSGQEAVHAIQWRFSDEISFVRPYLRERETAAKNENVKEEAENIEEADDIPSLIEKDKCENDLSQKRCAANSPNTDIKRSRIIIRPSSSKNINPPDTASTVLMKYLLEGNSQKEAKPMDPLDLFFQSMAATVKTFSPYHQNLCKTKVFSIVSGFEMKQIAEGTHTTSQTSGPSSAN